MKKLFILLIMLVSSNAMSQALIGYTPPELKNKLSNVDWEYSRWGNHDNLVMTWRNEDIVVNYFFNDDNITEYCTIAPLKQGGLQFLIEKYNNRYVVIDNSTWKFYSDGTIFLCKLKTLDDGRFYFVWSEE